MGCDKRYGLREVWVAPEASPNLPATFGQENYLQHCTGSNFPALYREALENAEATGTRGQSMPFEGSQAELAWDVTVMAPAGAIYGAISSDMPESLQALFWAAGFGGDTGPASWLPALSTGEKMVIKAGSACGRTLQLIGLDRDKRQLELLTGALVSQVVISLSRTDVCTIQFSGVAAQKYEATAPVLAPGMEGLTNQGAIVRSSFYAVLPTSPAILSGLELVLTGDAQEVATLDGYSETIILKNAWTAVISSDTQTYWHVDKPAVSSFYSVLDPNAWTCAALDSIQTATVTMETGQTYGELTTAAPYPSEILSGQVKVSASISAYLVDANMATVFDGSGAALLSFGLGSGAALSIAKARITERPAIDASSVDTPASGDFAFTAGEDGTFASAGALDTLYIN